MFLVVDPTRQYASLRVLIGSCKAGVCPPMTFAFPPSIDVHTANATRPTQGNPKQPKTHLYSLRPSVRRRVKMNENESGHENENGHRFTKTEARHFLAAAPPPLAHYAGALASPSPHSKPSTIRPVRACFSPSELASSAVHSETAHP